MMIAAARYKTAEDYAECCPKCRAGGNCITSAPMGRMCRICGSVVSTSPVREYTPAPRKSLREVRAACGEPAEAETPDPSYSTRFCRACLDPLSESAKRNEIYCPPCKNPGVRELRRR